MNFLVRAAQVLVDVTWGATHWSKPTEKAIPGAYPVGGHGGWIGLIRESFTGAWQRNVAVSLNTALTCSAVFRCISLISCDIAKMRVKLVRLIPSCPTNSKPSGPRSCAGRSTAALRGNAKD
jgi:hypothetical protein